MLYLDTNSMVYAQCVCLAPCSRRVHGASHPARSNMLLPVVVAALLVAKEHSGCRPSVQCSIQQEACFVHSALNPRMGHTTRCQWMWCPASAEP